jgi:hypothetical protein
MSEYEASVEWYWQGKTEGLGENPVPVPICPQIPHWNELDANPGFRGEKPATNRLNYGMVLAYLFKDLEFTWTEEGKDRISLQYH